MGYFFYLFISFLFLVIFGKEYLTLNEESLLISAFFLFFYFVYNTVSNLIFESLRDRSDQIFESINEALVLKRSNLVKLRSSYSILVSCAESLLVIFVFLKNLRHQKLNFWFKENLGMLYGSAFFDLEFLYELDVLTLKYFNILKLSKTVVE